MPIIVEVKNDADYAAWVAEQKTKGAAGSEDANRQWTLAELMAKGEQIFKGTCAACHQANGKGIPGAFPALDGSKVVTGPKAAQIGVVMNGVERDGKPTAMVAWKSTLSDVEIAAAITYTRNSWGNHTGEAIQPTEIKAAR